MFFVYILQNQVGRFYVGQTHDLAQRLDSHNDAGPVHAKFTRKNGPWQLVWYQEYPTRSAAVTRERQIKAMKSSRWILENLLKGRVPTRRD